MHSFKEFLGLNKARIYNLQHRKKPAELVRKDLISAMKMADHENLNREHYLRILDPWREEWEKGVQVPVNADALPQPTIKLIGDSADVVPSTSNSNSPIKPKTGHVNKELAKEPQFKLPTNLIKVSFTKSQAHIYSTIIFLFSMKRMAKLRPHVMNLIFMISVGWKQ